MSSTASKYRKQVFIDTYLKTWNGTGAARVAGFRCPGVAACRLLKDVNIQAEIESRLRAVHLSADAALARLAEIACADFSDFLKRDTAGKLLPIIDLEALALRGHLVKKYKAAGPKTPEELELHDALRALELIGKRHKLFTDSVDLTTDGNPIKFTVADIDLSRV